MIVVKVGGSLFDHPTLGPGLRDFLQTLAPKEVLLVPGGGPVADAVRKLDRTHELGEEAAHWLALRALGVTAELLRSLTSPLEGEVAAQRRVGGEGLGASISLPPHPARKASPTSPSREVKNARVLDCFEFALEDESRPGALPHTWSVTTDSIAARAAVVFGAERLILLKSVDISPGTPWEAAAANGWVDAHFPQIARAMACPIEIVNFRRELDAR